MIFDAKPRSRTAPKSRRESDYTFYDSSARPEFQVYRDLLNTWVAELPEADRSELITRFKKNDSLGYQATLAELVIHAALKRRGYSIELHPLTGHATRRLDYCVRDTAGAIASYVEVTSFGPAALTQRGPQAPQEEDRRQPQADIDNSRRDRYRKAKTPFPPFNRRAASCGRQTPPKRPHRARSGRAGRAQVHDIEFRLDRCRPPCAHGGTFKPDRFDSGVLLRMQPPRPQRAWRTKRKAPPGGPGGASGASAYSPFFLRLRDQIRVNPSPSSSSNRLAKIGALKLGSSSLSER